MRHLLNQLLPLAENRFLAEFIYIPAGILRICDTFLPVGQQFINIFRHTLRIVRRHEVSVPAIRNNFRRPLHNIKTDDGKMVRFCLDQHERKAFPV